MLAEFPGPLFYRVVDIYLEEIQVHIFGASELAFCAVGYLRLNTKIGQESVFK